MRGFQFGTNRSLNNPSIAPTESSNGIGGLIKFRLCGPAL